MSKLEDKDILEFAESQFIKLFRPKFEDGMRKYDSPIIFKDCLLEARQEGMDLWSYIHAEMAKRERALEITNKLMPLNASPEDIPLWLELKQLLSTAPMAKKKDQP